MTKEYNLTDYITKNSTINDLIDYHYFASFYPVELHLPTILLCKFLSSYVFFEEKKEEKLKI
jgi:hypothetical protein